METLGQLDDISWRGPHKFYKLAQNQEHELLKCKSAGVCTGWRAFLRYFLMEITLQVSL
jgi:uncharacterized protein (DUF488 family)